MSNSLNLFPSHIPIGVARDRAGNEIPVFSSPEWQRTLAILLRRVGGADGMGSDDLHQMLAETVLSGAQGASAQDIADLQAGQPVDQGAALATITSRIDDLAILAGGAAPPVVASEDLALLLLDVSVGLRGVLTEMAALRQRVADLEHTSAG